MGLKARINLIVGALTLLFVVALLAMQMREMRDSVHEEVVAANRVAGQLLNRAVWVYASRGTVAVRELLQDLGRVRSNDITLLNSADDVLYRSPPSPYKAGRDAPAWFGWLLAPVPSVQAIALPDGRLEVRADASRALLDAWDDFSRIALVALVLLAVVNMLVLGLVGRAVRPFGEIVAALNRLDAGRLDVALPPLAGSEAAALGAAFNRMVARLQQGLETERRAARAESELSDKRELARWVDHHVEQERRLIARELHDELGQSVTAMRSIALSIAQREPPQDAQTVQAARLIADEASRLYDAMHGLIPRLAPLVLDALGLEEALHDLAESTRRSQPAVQIVTTIELAAAALSPDTALALYRCAQEGITNALRHGQPRRIHLRVQVADAEVALDLVDDGRGLPDPAPRHPAQAGGSPGHHGLRWMAERAAGLGGSLSVQAAVPAGVHLRLALPLHGAADIEEGAGP
ncbi:Histidine kinase [Rubrivivax sp. A210]|uniref:HAMP domain-containing protein n=1 Tax=Rubrivivax sp. A210 TaxID=2772301 RepID=UPI001919E47C|nr:HAMP domain-containing protein [Rubrivivax sp. A210]CAD5366340.1 Histidine kinase [Rubrivivax sp. A210]